MDERFQLLIVALLDLPPRSGAEARRRGLAAVLAHPDDHRDLLRAEVRESLRSGAATRRALDEQRRCGEQDVAIVAFGEPDYPERLSHLDDPPPVLFVRGQKEALAHEPSVAVVGTRAASARGQSLARALARELGAAGAAVVSGLARGIDAAAHQGAVESGGISIGVLGSGLDCFYPRENEDLARAMTTRGAVVSEFPFGTRPHKQRFPQRNRVIAGLCQGVVVVEAPERSGALVTARLALDAGREVMAVPGAPGLTFTEGTNELLRDGATLVRHAADVAASLGLELRPSGRPSEDVARCPVRRLLTPGVPCGLEEIARRTGLSGPSLLSRLSELELQGVLRRLPGARYVVEE